MIRWIGILVLLVFLILTLRFKSIRNWIELHTKYWGFGAFLVALFALIFCLPNNEKEWLDVDIKQANGEFYYDSHENHCYLSTGIELLNSSSAPAEVTKVHFTFHYKNFSIDSIYTFLTKFFLMNHNIGNSRLRKVVYFHS